MEPHAVCKAKTVFEPLQDLGPETAHTKNLKREMNTKLMAFLILWLGCLWYFKGLEVYGMLVHSHSANGSVREKGQVPAGQMTF